LVPNPQDADVNRHCAVTLGRIGQFDQAISCWTRVDETLRGDDEAQRMISELQIKKSGLVRDDSKPAANARGTKRPPEQQKRANRETSPRKEIELSPRQKLERAVSNNPTDTDSYFELAQIHIDEGRLGDATHVLTKAVAASGGDIKARERLEDVEILRKAEQVQIAEQRMASGNDPEAAQLVEQLRADLNHFEMEVFGARAERYPQDGEVQFQFGLRLKQAENYRMAIPSFHQAIQHPRRRQAALLELGECLQRTRQYGQALECYLKAVETAQAARDLEAEKMARYRSGLLAFGLKNYATAEAQMAALVKLDPGYKDAAARLDKIHEMRHKG
jgi:tetratricopeptide (TPR) repeat protein